MFDTIFKETLFLKLCVYVCVWTIFKNSVIQCTGLKYSYKIQGVHYTGCTLYRVFVKNRAKFMQHVSGIENN